MQDEQQQPGRCPSCPAEDDVPFHPLAREMGLGKHLFYEGGKTMTKLFEKILSLTLALLMLAGCASTPATEPADPLEGTMTVEPFDAEKLASASGSSDYACIGDKLENCFFGREARMFECAAFGKILSIELVTVKPSEKLLENFPRRIPAYLKYVRYEIEIEEVVQNVTAEPTRELQAGKTITLYHPYEIKLNNDHKEVPNYMEVGKTYALTFMETHEYAFYYNKSVLPVDYHSPHREYKAEGIETIWKIPLTEIGDFFLRWIDYHAFEVEGDEVCIQWQREVADRYFEGTPYEKDVNHRGTASYRVSKEFFRQFVQVAYEDSLPFFSEQAMFFDMRYMAKHDPEGYQEYLEYLEGMMDRFREKMNKSKENSSKN